MGKNVGYIGAADLNNPNSKEFSRGIQGDDVPFSFRMSVSTSCRTGFRSAARISIRAAFRN